MLFVRVYSVFMAD